LRGKKTFVNSDNTFGNCSEKKEEYKPGSPFVNMPEKLAELFSQYVLVQYGATSKSVSRKLSGK
jgi:hypothetical protein